MCQKTTSTTKTTTIFLLAAILLMAVTIVSGKEAEAVVSGEGVAPPSNTGMGCRANLGLCAAVLKEGGKPSEECCTGLEQATKTQLKCLCTILMDPQVLAAFNLTVENALLIPKNCGIETGSSMCSVAKAPLPHGEPPVSGPPKDDKGDATKLAETGLVGIVLVTISMIFY